MSSTIDNLSKRSTATSHRVWAWFVGTALVAAIAVVGPGLAAVPFAFLVAAAVWRWPSQSLAWAAVTVLVVRPSLDSFSERRLGLGPFEMSPAVAFGLLVLLVAGVLAVRRLIKGQSVWPDRSLFVTHAWLALAYMIALTAGYVWYGGFGAGVGMREAVRMGSVVGAFLLLLWWVEERPERYRMGLLYLASGA